MNKSMLAGVGIGVAAALGIAAVASLDVFSAGPQYAQVLAATPIKETIKTPRQECRNVTVTHRAPVQDENRIAGSVLGAVAGGVAGVAGLMRRRVIALLAGSEYRLHCVSEPLETLADADEVLVSNALMPLLPVNVAQSWRYHSRQLYDFLRPHC